MVLIQAQEEEDFLKNLEKLGVGKGETGRDLQCGESNPHQQGGSSGRQPT